MNEDIKYNSLKSVKKRSKANKRKIMANVLIIFVLLSVTSVSFILNNNFEQRARQINDDTCSFVQLSEYNSGIEDEIPWNLILVNAWNDIPDNFSVNLKTLEDDLQVDERIYPDLLEMFDAARAVGVYPLVGAAYRTNEKQ
ncbi:MAG: hypothetical protein JJE03_06365 [Peptostreptococcaceae bacterium]|nr:hypothetical protein [Peptostreptococcaceae bacterium]